jgi:hypothetical protein
LGAVPRVAVGSTYRQGGEFDFRGASFERCVDQTSLTTFERHFQPVSTLGVGQPTCNRANRVGRAPWNGVFKVPDVAGLGVSVSLTEAWVVAFDYNRVEYSDLIEENLDITGAGGNRGSIVRNSPFELEDGNEYRAGFQHAIVSDGRGADVFFRGGLWIDPDHIVRFVGQDPVYEALFRGGDDELHYAGGIGVRLPYFQIDMGADVSRRLNTFSISSVFFLGRS